MSETTSDETVMWWRETRSWRDRLRGRSYRRGVAITESEPGVVLVTTDALADLLRLAGFKREEIR